MIMDLKKENLCSWGIIKYINTFTEMTEKEWDIRMDRDDANHEYNYDSYDRRHGQCKRFYPGGDIMHDWSYKHGKQHGRHTSWYSNNDSFFSKYYENNTQEGEEILCSPIK
jgi:antitoxin component YwqK of YwqJK toxin-antitoxin module